MKVSVNQLRFLNEHYGSAGDPAPDGVEALVKKIGAQLGAVEETIDFGTRFKDVLIVKVVEYRKHENSDHLNVCKIDDGGRAEDVQRDENGFVQVVCGAPNVRVGLITVWLPPKTAVPESIAKGEPFVLEARELRGELSNGMLASPRELTIGDSHEGIVEVDLDGDEDVPAPGTRFVEAYHLDGDVIIDIENKMFTHRPDCFGYFGIARELEGIQHRPYKSPEWYKLDAQPPELSEAALPVEVRNEVPDLVPRFIALSMQNVEVHDSPTWLQLDLARVGLRPINNIVDYTNFYMLETGQPLHAYDYDKLKALCNENHAVLNVRHPHEGEKLTLLNGKEVQPRAEAIMIATDKQLIGIGGVMGGADTEVDANTRNIVLECATFDMYSIRKTSMAHGLFTDAVTRFSKGQSPLQNRAVICKIADEIARFAGGKVAGLVDDNHLSEEVMRRGSLFAPVVVTAEFINVRLGLKLSAEQMKALLENVEFKVGIEDQTLTITAPFWRTDIEIAEDVVEEIGRLYGFDHLPLTLPTRTLTPPSRNRLLELKSAIRTSLSEAGANEVLTYSFVHGDLLDKVGQDKSQAFQLSNALSPDLQYYRLSLLPSLLDKVHANVKAGHDEFALFEMNKVHDKTAMDEDGLPLEFDNLALVYAAQKPSFGGAPYYQARKFLEHVASSLGHAVVFQPLRSHAVNIDALFEPGRSAVVCFKGSDQGFGVVGEFKASVRKKLKLPEHAAGFEIGIGAFFTDEKVERYVALPKFPKVEQDVCLKVPAGLNYQELYDFVFAQLEKTALPKSKHSLTPVDIYQREDDREHKQITLRFSVASYEKTLRDEEVTHILDELAEAAHEKFQAERM
ncbi:MAG TPA: phenylalanine--tRNA ligase subunit beta [Candidatus Saccharimonadales bacterium]